MAQFGPKGGHGSDELTSPDEILGIQNQNFVQNNKLDLQNDGLSIKGLTKVASGY